MKYTIKIVKGTIILFGLLAMIDLGFWLTNQQSTIAFIGGVLLNLTVISGILEFIYKKYKKQI
jgi:hypothetical protein